MNSKNPEMHDCECGFLWRHGQSGDHSCGPYFRQTIAELRAAAAPQVVADERAARIESALTRLLASDPATAACNEDDLSAAANDTSAPPFVREQAAAMLQARAALAAAPVQAQEPVANASADIFDLIREWAHLPEGQRGDAAREIIGGLNRSYSAGVSDGKELGRLSAPVQAQEPRKPTDISQRLREYAGNSGYSHNDYADTMRVAADECERFYGGMVAWKETAQQKDRTIIDLRAKLAEAAQVQTQEPVIWYDPHVGATDVGLLYESTRSLSIVGSSEGPFGNFTAALYRAQAQPVAVPDGWKLAPIEPTDAMILGPGALRTDGKVARIHRDVWKRMMEAVPAAPAAQGDAETLQKVRDAVEQFKVEWMRVPYFAHRVNKAVRDQIGTATSIVVNIPCIIDAAIAAKAAS